MSTENLIWFEFLLNPSLLDVHLSQSNPDPLPISLIVQFIYNGMRKTESLPIESDVFDPSAKQISEKKKHIMAIIPLKIASFLNWNIELFQQKLPIHIQNSLFLLLLEQTLDTEFHNPTTHANLDLGLLLPHQLFSLSLYHRWALSALIMSKLPLKVPKVSNVPIPGQQDPMLEHRELQESIHSVLESNVEHSLRILEQLLTAGEVKSITMAALSVIPNREDRNHDWSLCKHIPDEEFKCQIHYDLGIYQFDNYTTKESICDAFDHFKSAMSFLNEIGSTTSYCQLKKEKLQAYHDSCASFCGRSTPLEKRNLYDRYMHSIKNRYEGILEILLEDNLEHKIADYIRHNLQFNLLINEDAPEGLLFRVHTMNVLRDTFDGEISDSGYILALLQAGKPGAQYFIETITSSIAKLNDEQRALLKNLLLSLICNDGMTTLISPFIALSPQIQSLFTKEEFENIFDSKVENDTVIEPDPALGADLDSVSDLTWLLILSYDNNILKQCCKNYLEAQRLTNNSQKPILELNSKWVELIPKLVRNKISVVISEPDRSFSLILIAKSQELVPSKNFDKSLELLNETFNIISTANDYDLTTMVSWLLLVREIQQQIHHLPCVEENEVRKLAVRAKKCMSESNTRDRLVPSADVTYWCKVLLLNAQEWTINVPGESHSPIQRLANVAQCLFDKKTVKRSNRVPCSWQEFFDLATDILNSGCGLKREYPSQSSERYRSSGNGQYGVFLELLESVKEPNCLSILISVFGHIFNILCEEPLNHIHIDHSTYWPAKYSGQNCLNFVQEVLGIVLDHATELYPLGSHINTSTCASWFLTKADAAFYQEKYHNAIQNYLTAIFVATDYLRNDTNIPEQNHMTEIVLKRMIKCCKCLGSYTQAAILCQFLTNIDYNTALQCLQERNAIDAMDACYNCLWDVTLIEFIINMHQKRGEIKRRNKALSIIGLLEINSNNNEEIQREAAKVRKHRFLRSLAKQYL